MCTAPAPGPHPEDLPSDDAYVEDLVRRSTIGERLSDEDYEQLRRIARGMVRGWGPSPSLDATGLVNDALLRAANKADPGPDRRLGYVAEIMRNLLRDRARRKKTEKHGGAVQHVTVHSGVEGETPMVLDLVALNEALEAMQQSSPRLYAPVKLRFFSEASTAQISAELGISAPTVRDRLRLGLAALRRVMEGSGP